MKDTTVLSAAAVVRLPALDADNQAFWTRGAAGELAICRCRACRLYIHPPSAACPSCASVDVAAEAVSGRGVVASYSVNHQPWVPGQEVPFVLAVIELEEQPGLMVISNIVGCEPERVHIGLRVAAYFAPHGDVWLPLFAPEEA